MRPLRRVAIVGGSLAGIHAAEALRREGFDGDVTMIGEERHLPYDRPPLSKQYLSGSWEVARTSLRTDDALGGLNLDLRAGRAAVGLDPSVRRLQLAGGDEVEYDALLIATGTTPRRLASAEGLRGVHTLRTLDDATAIRTALDQEPRVVVVGGGFIGAEVAGEARRRGLDVTMLEAMPVPLSRGLGERMGQVCADLYLDRGVDVRCGVTVRGFEGRDRVERVVLDDGTAVPADLAVVGVGSVPATAWLRTSGVPVDDGVLCDAFCRAGVPGVYAAGDVARWHHPSLGGSSRLEHWTNAREQAGAAIRTMLADHDGDRESEAYAPVPYVWSDQFGTRIQVAGRTSSRPEDVAVVHEDPASGSTLALYRFEDRLGGVVALNASKRMLSYRRMIVDGVSWQTALLAS